VTDSGTLSGGDATRFDYGALAQLERNEENRLELVRSRSEKWVGGLTALTGLIGTVLIVKGPESISDIRTMWRGIVGALVAAALGLLAFATYRAYQSAYGSPGLLVEIAPTPLQGLSERLTTARHKAATTAQNHLKQALISAFLGIAALAAATGITWFAPIESADSAETICLSIDGRTIVEVPGDRLAVERMEAGVTVAPCP